MEPGWGLALTQAVTERTHDPGVAAVALYERQQLGTGCAGMAQSSLSQARGASGGVTGRQQAVVHIAEQVGGAIGQSHGHQQIRQIVVSHNQRSHRLIGVMPLHQLLTSQPERLLIMSQRLMILAAIKQPITLSGLLFPVTHAAATFG